MSTTREEALQGLEEKVRRNFRREFAGLVVKALEGESDFDMKNVLHHARGPLGGRSTKIFGVFTDAEDKKHGVIINMYIGEPDVNLDENDTIVPNGR